MTKHAEEKKRRQGEEGEDARATHRELAEVWLGEPITLECVRCKGRHIVPVQFPLVVRCICEAVTLYYDVAVTHLFTYRSTSTLVSHLWFPEYDPIEQASLYFSRLVTIHKPGENQSTTTVDGVIDCEAIPVSTPFNAAVLRHRRRCGSY